MNYLRIAAWIAIVAVVGFVEYKVYHAGYTSAGAFYQAEIQSIKDASTKEVARQVAVDKVALDTANQQVTELQEMYDRVNQKVIDNAVQASKDSHARRPAFGLGSVQRLNSAGGLCTHVGKSAKCS